MVSEHNIKDNPINASAFRRLLFLAAFVSLLFSMVIISIPNPINPDGILYLKTASAFLESGWQGASAIYPWPFFSACVAELSRYSHLSLEHAAYVLDSGFQALIVIAFILLVKELSNEKTVIYWAAVAILAYASLNTLRACIVRDFGYWAFALLALLYLIRYTRNPRWHYAILWGALMGIAVLFRIEGAVLLILAPLGLFSLPLNWQIVKNIVKVYIVPLLGITFLFMWALCHPNHHLGRIIELLQQIHHGFITMVQTINHRADVLAQTPAILGVEARDNAKTILFSGLMGIFALALLKTVTPLYLFLSGYAQYYRLLPTTVPVKNILRAFILINLLILIIFTGQQFFIDRRYLMLLSFILMLWVPTSLATLHRTWRSGKAEKRWLFPVVFVGLLSMMIMSGVIRFVHAKAYIVDAGLWLKQHTSENIRLYSNSSQVLFYADKKRSDGDMKQHSWENYDYVAIRINLSDTDYGAKVTLPLNRMPIQVFQNKRGDRVMLYKIGQK